MPGPVNRPIEKNLGAGPNRQNRQHAGNHHEDGFRPGSGKPQVRRRHQQVGAEADAERRYREASGPERTVGQKKQRTDRQRGDRPAP